MWSTSEYLKPSALTRYWPTTRSILFAVTLVTIVVIHQTDGCQYSKFSPQHTMCFYKSPGCPLKQKGLSKDEITFILDEHNRYRQKVANGQVKQVNQPPAADMRQMEWDNEIAMVAQKWAEQCKTQHDCPDCRQLPRFRLGQNIYMFASTEDNATTDWLTACNEWYKEVSIFPSRKINPFMHPQSAGHYTQLAWANTHKIGCGYAYYQKGKWYTKLYVCNYGPAGNILEDRMYITGPACSACPEGTSCSKSYPGLCAETNSAIDVSYHSKPITVPTQEPWWLRPARTTSKPTSYRPWWVIQSTATTAAIQARPMWTLMPQPFPTSLTPAKRTMLYCDFDAKGCNLDTMGTTSWTIRRSNSIQGTYYDIHVKRGNDGHLYVYMPSENNSDKKRSLAANKACLSFIYKKYPLGGGKQTVDLEVAVWRSGQQGPYTEFKVSSNANGWMTHKKSVPVFDDIYSISFHMVVPRNGPNGDQYAAIDQIRLEEGPC